VRLGQREPDRIAGALDLIGHERDAELLHQPGQLTFQVMVSFFRRITFDHFAADVDGTIRRAGDERASFPGSYFPALWWSELKVGGAFVAARRMVPSTSAAK